MTSKKKKKGRVRQTRTEWQKVFDQHPGMIQPFSWSDRLPEVLHISIALLDHDYQTVKSDFIRIANFVNDKTELTRKFHFNLSNTIKLIKSDQTILDEILKTSFKDAFIQLIRFYRPIFQMEMDLVSKMNIKLLLLGYKQILNGRSDISILCKYLMVQYEQIGRPDPSGLFSWNTVEEILEPQHVSNIMACFPPSIGLSENLDLEFCEDLWMHNYIYAPLMPEEDDSKRERKRFKEMKVEGLKKEFERYYADFKKLNLIAIYPKTIAEINMGFVSRISNLSIETVDLVKNHKGEIAELVFRTNLETFIVASWLLKRRDPALHQRFRDYSTGRQRFFGEQIAERAADDSMKKSAEKLINDAFTEAGVREIDVASERGDIFELRIDQMAEEVFGKDNLQYFLYKRTSEVVHGHWRVIAKYHLSRSHNPLHNGLYSYNNNIHRFAGLVPAFASLGIAVDFLLIILKDIKAEQTKTMEEGLTDLHKRLWEQYMSYFNTYIEPQEK